MDREACRATVHEVTKSQTQLKLLSTQYPLGISMLSQMPRFHSFLWLIFHICICYIFIHSSIMDTWVASVFGDCRYCCSEQRGTYIFSNQCFHFLWVIPRNGISGLYCNSVFNFFRNLCTVFLAAAPIYSPIFIASWFPFLHILVNTCYLLVTAILTGKR